VLFIPLAFLVIDRDRMPVAARRVLFAIFGLALGQNLVLVMFVRSHLEIASAPVLLLVSLLKAGPLLLFWAWLVGYGPRWIGLHRGPAAA
jgi:hypothetical protein